jgi:ribose transport system substrate-binding protein
MKKLSLVLSLTTDDNDYQIEQASAAEESARRLGVGLQIIYAENDAIIQSQQLLKFIQSGGGATPDGIIFEPVGGTALPQVARAAAAAKIGWVVLNRDVDYVSDLRKTHRVPIFGLTSDHEEIGRIQGRQFGALLPKGGSVLYIQGPSESLAAKQRTSGMYETKPIEVQVKLMKANWTEASSYKTLSSWLRLSKTGQAWVKKGLLAATVVVPPNAGKAVEMLSQALQSGSVPAERTLNEPVSFPTLDQLAEQKTRARSAGSIR